MWGDLCNTMLRCHAMTVPLDGYATPSVLLCLCRKFRPVDSCIIDDLSFDLHSVANYEYDCDMARSCYVRTLVIDAVTSFQAILGVHL